MVDYAAAFRPHLDADDVPVLHQAEGKAEAAVDVVAVARHREIGRSLQNYVRRAQRPLIGKLERRGEVAGVAFRGARIHPVSDEVDVILTQPALMLKLTIPR